LFNGPRSKSDYSDMKIYYLICLISALFIINNANSYSQEKGETAKFNDSYAFFIDDSVIRSSESEKLKSEADTAFTKKEIAIILFHMQKLIDVQAIILKKYQYILFGSLFVLCLIIILSLVKFIKNFILYSFPVYKQKKDYSPGFVCLRMVMKYYGERISYKKVRKKSISQDTAQPLSLLDIANTSEKLGFKAEGYKTGLTQLITDLPLPALLYFPNHVVVVYKIENEFVYLADPFYGLQKLNLFYFVNTWYTDIRNQKGIVLTLKPGTNFRNHKSRKRQLKESGDIKQLDKKYLSDYLCELSTE